MSADGSRQTKPWLPGFRLSALEKAKTKKPQAETLVAILALEMAGWLIL